MRTQEVMDTTVRWGEAEAFDEELLRLEMENRIRNLAWTASGDYSWTVQPDVELYQRSHARGIYEPIRQGGFFRYYDRGEFSLYLLKKMYYQADSQSLARASKLCMDAAVWKQLTAEMQGIPEMRRRAAEDFLEQEFGLRSAEPLGRLELFYMSRSLGSEITMDPAAEELLGWLENLGEACPEDYRQGTVSAMPVIAMVDHIYNTLVDPEFEKRHGDLEFVLSLTLTELAEADFDWTEFLKEEALEDRESRDAQEFTEGMGNPDPGIRKTTAVEVNSEDKDKIYAYMELNYGRSYMNERERRRIEHQVCRGMHQGCSLYFTDGILENMVRKNYQSEYVRHQYSYNMTTFRRSTHMAKRNIQLLTDTLRQALLRRTEIDTVRSDSGFLQVNELWKVGRTGDNRLCRKEIRRDGMDFVVDILMDGSGSQRTRRGEVAVQAYIICEALSNVGIPHRVQSFCTCWDYTILQRFREYDDPRETNRKVFEFSTSANNRDGLAIRTIVQGLQARPEENKILIVLSDGRPNDRAVGPHMNSAASVYVGDVAVNDTAAEVRKARHQGIAVLGVFAGMEEDVNAEKRIFGRDFAYIRQIGNFSRIVGLYLRRQLDSGE